MFIPRSPFDYATSNGPSALSGAATSGRRSPTPKAEPTASYFELDTTPDLEPHPFSGQIDNATLSGALKHLTRGYDRSSFAAGPEEKAGLDIESAGKEKGKVYPADAMAQVVPSALRAHSFAHLPGGGITTWFFDPKFGGSRVAADDAPTPLRFETRSLAELGRHAPQIGDPQFSTVLRQAVAERDQPMVRALAEALQHDETQAQPLAPLGRLGAAQLLVDCVAKNDVTGLQMLRDVALLHFQVSQPSGPATSPADFRRKYPPRAIAPLFRFNQADEQGDTVYHHVARHGSADALDALATSCDAAPAAEFLARNARGETPVITALRAGNGKLVDCFVKHANDAQLSTKKFDQMYGADNAGDTALHLAVAAGNAAVVKHLSSHVSKLTMQPNSAGETPYDLAQRLGRPVLAKDIYENDVKARLDALKQAKLLPPDGTYNTIMSYVADRAGFKVADSARSAQMPSAASRVAPPQNFETINTAFARAHAPQAPLQRESAAASYSPFEAMLMAKVSAAPPAKSPFDAIAFAKPTAGATPGGPVFTSPFDLPRPSQAAPVPRDTAPAKAEGQLLPSVPENQIRLDAPSDAQVAALAPGAKRRQVDAKSRQLNDSARSFEYGNALAPNDSISEEFKRFGFGINTAPSSGSYISPFDQPPKQNNA